MSDLEWARATPAGLAWLASREQWVLACHLALINRKLIDLAAGRIKRLIVTLPPRHGKSEFISKYFPAWYLGRFPDRRVILSSYEADFAASWGRKVRDIIEEFGLQVFGIKINPNSSAGNRWDLFAHLGGMNTAGVGGAITGKGAHLFIIDDPVKNAQDAFSPTLRESNWDWFRSTAYTRLEPGGSMVIMLTRWHEDDLVGRILGEMKVGGEKWELINIPAIAEHNDILNRNTGEALWPERYPLEVLEEKERTLGPYWFSAMYQQRPQAETGAIFKREHFRYFTIEAGNYVMTTPQGKKYAPISTCAIFQTCDPAASTKSTADYFALGTWAKTQGNDLLLLDMIRIRIEGPDQLNLFQQAYQRWKPSLQMVETASMGITLYQTLLRAGLPVRELKAEVDKVIRAYPAAARIQAGMVYFLAGAPWLGEYEAELTAFNKGAHDDQVDVTSYAVNFLVNNEVDYEKGDAADMFGAGSAY
jgi:predicted phage terminase large subunit-like protein